MREAIVHIPTIIATYMNLKVLEVAETPQNKVN